MSKKLVTIESLALTQRQGGPLDPAQFADTTFQNYAEKIFADYENIIKACVLPHLTDLGDLKLRDLKIITIIHFFDVPITPAQVSELLRFDPATVSRSIKKLVSCAMVIREDNGRDKRSIRLKLSLKGSELAKSYVVQVKTVFEELEQGLLYGLTKEEKITFLNVMMKISRRAEAMKILANI